MREIATNGYAACIAPYQDGNFCRDGGNFGRNPPVYSRGKKLFFRSIDGRLSCYGLVYLFWDQHKVSKKTVLMRSKTRLSRLTGMMSVLCLITGCASEFSVFSASGEPLLISRRGYTPGECTGMVKEDAARMGVTLRYVHIRGNTVGRSLLWPFEPGYACEAAIGPPDGPIGIYPGSPHVIIRGS